MTGSQPWWMNLKQGLLNDILEKGPEAYNYVVRRSDGPGYIRVVKFIASDGEEATGPRPVSIKADLQFINQITRLGTPEAELFLRLQGTWDKGGLALIVRDEDDRTGDLLFVQGTQAISLAYISVVRALAEANNTCVAYTLSSAGLGTYWKKKFDEYWNEQKLPTARRCLLQSLYCYQDIALNTTVCTTLFNLGVCALKENERSRAKNYFERVVTTSEDALRDWSSHRDFPAELTVDSDRERKSTLKTMKRRATWAIKDNKL